MLDMVITAKKGIQREGLLFGEVVIIKSGNISLISGDKNGIYY